MTSSIKSPFKQPLPPYFLYMEKRRAKADHHIFPLIVLPTCFLPFMPLSIRHFHVSLSDSYSVILYSVRILSTVCIIEEKGKGSWCLQPSGVFPNLSQETSSSFGERAFDADCSLWSKSSLITSKIHLNIPSPIPQPCHLYGCPVFVS